MTQTLIVEHARVLDPSASHWLDDHHVWAEDGQIREVSATRFGHRPDGARLIDGRGLALIPGLIDCHVHVGARVVRSQGGSVLIPGLIDCHVHVTFSSLNLG